VILSSWGKGKQGWEEGTLHVIHQKDRTFSTQKRTGSVVMRERSLPRELKDHRKKEWSRKSKGEGGNPDLHKKKSISISKKTRGPLRRIA